MTKKNVGCQGDFNWKTGKVRILRGCDRSRLFFLCLKQNKTAKNVYLSKEELTYSPSEVSMEAYLL